MCLVYAKNLEKGNIVQAGDVSEYGLVKFLYQHQSEVKHKM